MRLARRLEALEQAAPVARSGVDAQIADACPMCQAAVFIAHPIPGAETGAAVALCTLCRAHFLTRAAVSHLVAVLEREPDGQVAKLCDAPRETPEEQLATFTGLLTLFGVPIPGSEFWRQALRRELDGLHALTVADIPHARRA